MEVAEDLADAIRSAAWGERWSESPAWWHDFEKQYEKREWESNRDTDARGPETDAEGRDCEEHHSTDGDGPLDDI